MGTKSEKSRMKQERKKLREVERKKEQQRMKWMVLVTSAVVIVLIAAGMIYAPKPKPVDFAYQDLPVLGQADAPVKIVEFGDFKCPSCKYFSERIKPLLMEDYINKGSAALYFMNHTIIGPDSFAAAMAGQSIFHQSNDAFWKFYDAIYVNQGPETVQWATPEFLVELAKGADLQIDYDKLQEDIVNEAYAEEVIAQNAKAEPLISGTPTLFINGVKFEDFSNYDALKKAIDKAAKEAAKQAAEEARQGAAKS
jgi:protein-disulfide isomerase